ncbi:MAG: HupE/UreJ family protein [Chthoniobacterales bacterium]
MNFLKKSLIPLGLLLCLPTLAQAHVGGAAHAEFLDGVLHPLTGLDHLFAILALGLWAAQLGGRATWGIPLGFAGAMLLSAVLGMGRSGSIVIEQGILASVFILGLLLVFSVRLPVFAGGVLVALFAFFHGFAHGAEMPAGASPVVYILGFVITTLLISFLGVALGTFGKRLISILSLRLAGGAIAACAVYLFFQ